MVKKKRNLCFLKTGKLACCKGMFFLLLLSLVISTGYTPLLQMQEPEAFASEETGGSGQNAGSGKTGETGETGQNEGETGETGETGQTGGETGETEKQSEPEETGETEKQSEPEETGETEKQSEPEETGETEKHSEPEETAQTETQSGQEQIIPVRKRVKGNVVALAKKRRGIEDYLFFSGGKTRYQLPDGSFLTDTWIQISEDIYYFDIDGNAVTGEFEIGRRSYYFDRYGHLYVNKRRTVGTQEYYYGNDACMLKDQWMKRAKKWYYFQSDGTMAKSKWVRGCWVKANGCLDMTKGKKKTGTFKPKTKTQKLIVIGASRVKHIKLAVGEKKNVVFIAKGGAGYSWFEKTALKSLHSLLKKYPGSKVVIQLGNNDFSRGKKNGNLGKYVRMYRKLIKKYRKASFFFMDILPKLPLDCSRNKNAEAFNKALRKAFPGRCIGGYDYLIRHGFAVSYNDEHYSVDTSRKIFNYILKKVA